MTPALEDLPWRLQEIDCSATSPDAVALLQPWLETAERSEALRLFFCIVSELRRFNLTWVTTEFENRQLALTATERREIAQAIYHDWAEAGQPHWNAFVPLGFTADELALRAPTDRFPLGTSVGDGIRLMARRGEGAVAVVYEGHGWAHDTRVAVKVPRNLRDDQSDPLADRIRSEARLLGSLSIEGVPKVLALLETNQGPVVVQEFIEGVLLSDHLRTTKPTLSDRLALIADVASIIDAVHRQGLIHSDLKLENVLIRTDGKPFVIDFNVARTHDSTDPDRIMGTIPMMSPDAMLGTAMDVDLRQDIHALGALLFGMINERPLVPFAEWSKALIEGTLISRPGSTFDYGMPERIARICRCAISRDPSDRFETAADFADACRAAARGDEETGSLPPPRPLLTAWRLGNCMGLFMTRLGRLAAAVEQGRDCGPRDTLPPSVRNELLQAMGTTLAVDDLRPLGKRLGMEIPPCTVSDELAIFYYRASRLTGEDYPTIAGAVTNAKEWHVATWQLIEERLRDSALESYLVLCAALQARLAPMSPAARENWPSVAERSRIFPSARETFSTLCRSEETEVDWAEAIRFLDLRVVQAFRWDRDDQSAVIKKK